MRKNTGQEKELSHADQDVQLATQNQQKFHWKYNKIKYSHSQFPKSSFSCLMKDITDFEV